MTKIFKSLDELIALIPEEKEWSLFYEYEDKLRQRHNKLKNKR